MSARRGRALLICENEGVPLDRRVWAEARTIAAAGWEVAVVCPHAENREEPISELVEGIEIHRFPLRRAGSATGYVREYIQAVWRIRRVVRRLERDGAFDVVHVANPPDFLRLAARGPMSRGASLVFDHHDLVPELFESRFSRRGAVHRLLLAIERRSIRSADVVISTNDSYRRLAIERGGAREEDVFVVRNGPDLERFVPTTGDPLLRHGQRYFLAYLGVMGPQDGIDHALRALAELRSLRGPDWRAAFIGDGEVLGEMSELAERLEIGHLVDFAGWRGDDDIRRYLSTADVCIAPDPPGPLNDVSTMAKIPEYMAIGRAIASYDLPESRVTAGDAAAYAGSPDPAALGRCINELLEDPERRARMGAIGRKRVAGLSWECSARSLLAAYGHATRSAAPATGASGRIPVGGPAHSPGHELR